MRKIRKLTAVVLLTALMMTLFVSCSGETAEDSGKIKVLTTNFAVYDIARQVAGDTADVSMLLPPETEAHDYELTLTDAAKIANADLFVCVGGESEDWVSDLFDSMKEDERPRTVRAIDFAVTADEELVNSVQQDGLFHEEEEEADEHVWTSFENIRHIAEGVAENLCDLIPEKVDTVRENLAAFENEADELEGEYRKMIGESKRKTVVFADRFPFLYLAEEMGLAHTAAFSGCSSNVEASLATIYTLIQTVEAEEIPAIFIIEFSDGKCAEAVAAETGCEILTLQSAHNVTAADFEAGVTLLELMRQNLEALKIALN